MASSRVGIAGTINSGDLVSASGINALPNAELGRDTLSSNSAGTTSTETVCSVTVDVGAGDRQILVMACLTVRTDIAGGAQAALYMDGTQIQRKNQETIPPTSDQSWEPFISLAPSAGSHTFTLVTGVSGGAGNTVTCIANGATASHGNTQLLVIDNGPSY